MMTKLSYVINQSINRSFNQSTTIFKHGRFIRINVNYISYRILHECRVSNLNLINLSKKPSATSTETIKSLCLP